MNKRFVLRIEFEDETRELLVKYEEFDLVREVYQRKMQLMKHAGQGGMKFEVYERAL